MENQDPSLIEEDNYSSSDSEVSSVISSDTSYDSDGSDDGGINGCPSGNSSDSSEYAQYYVSEDGRHQIAVKELMQILEAQSN